MSPRTRLRLAATALATIGAVAAVVALAPTSEAATTVQFSVGTGNGAFLADNYVGLSFEANVLAGTAASAGNLAQYMKTLGPGVMRFGGNFVDTTFWTSDGEAAPSWAVATLTPADLTRLNTLAVNSGWRVILGVNLKHPDPARAADEAAHAKAALGSRLLAIEIGNEPNYYTGYSSAALWADYQRYRSAINASAPGVGLQAPSIGRVSTADAWLTDFASREAGHVDVAELTAHYYPACAKDNPAPTITSLLSTGYRTSAAKRFQLLASQAGKLGVPGVLNEGNSVSCEGTDGVSDTFTSALWGIDYQLLGAQSGLAGLYLHSAIAKCGAAKPLYKAYTPFCAATDADATAGLLRARPVYYSSLMLQQVGTGYFQPVSGGDLGRLRAYALRNGSRLRLMLVNVSTAAVPVTASLGQKYTQGDTVALTAASLTSQTGILLGGHFVGTNGTYAGSVHTPLSINASTLSLTLPAASALLVTLNP